MIYRAGKTILTAVMGVYFLLIAFNNTTDYQSNFVFVQHVLSMDTQSLPTLESHGGQSTVLSFTTQLTGLSSPGSTPRVCCALRDATAFRQRSTTVEDSRTRSHWLCRG